MADQLDLVKSFVLPCAGSTPQDIMTALSDHFASGNNVYWQRTHQEAQAESLGLSLKAAYTDEIIDVDPHVVLRRANTGWRVLVDPDKTVSDAGTANVAPTLTSTNHSGELESFVPAGLAPWVLLSELPDCLLIALVNSAKDAVPWFACLGHGYMPCDRGWADYGIDGMMALSGLPIMSSSAGTDYIFSTSTDSAAIKSGRVTSQWGRAVVQNTSAGANNFEPDGAGTGEIILPTPYEISARVGVTSRKVGATKYFREYPDGTYAPLVVANAVGHSWLFINNTNAATDQVMIWESGVQINL